MNTVMVSFLSFLLLAMLVAFVTGFCMAVGDVSTHFDLTTVAADTFGWPLGVFALLGVGFGIVVRYVLTKARRRVRYIHR